MYICIYITTFPVQFEDLLTSKSSYCASYKKFVDVISNFQAQKKIYNPPCHKYKLRNTSDSPGADAFHSFDPRNIPTGLPNGFGIGESNVMY